MKGRRIKFMGLLVLILAVTITLGACDLDDDPEPEDTFNLTVDYEGVGETTPDAGTHEFEQNTMVDLEAVPRDEDWEFAYWEGDVSNRHEASTQVFMDGDKEVTAVFVESDEADYDLTINYDGRGTTQPEMGTHTYEANELVEIVAEAAEGWEFDYWRGDVMEADENVANVYMDADKEVTAVFAPEDEEEEKEQYELIMDQDGQGDISPSIGRHEYEEYELVELEAIPAEGWQFERWEGDVTNPDSPETSIQMEEDQEVTAIFTREEIEEYELSIEKIGEGEVDPPAGTYDYEADTEVELEAIPAEDWEFDHWRGNVADPHTAETTIRMSEDENVTAVFAEDIEYYTVEFRVVDEAGDPLEDAEINLNEEEASTDDLGEAVFEDVKEGIYNYTVDKEGYLEVTGSLTVESDVNESVTLEEDIDEYDLKFEVQDDDGSPVERAVVEVEDMSRTTDEQGEAVFEDLTEDTYEYEVDKENYDQVEGTVELDTDMTYVVNLEQNIEEYVIFEQDFSDYSLGEYPDNWSISGNSDQEVVDSPAYNHNRALRMSGSHGGNWRALAHREFELPDPDQDGRMIIDIQARPTNIGEEGNHSGNGRISLYTNDAWHWDSQDNRRLVAFEPDGTISTPEDAGIYNVGEWNDIEIIYEVDGNDVIIELYVNNEYRGEYVEDREDYEEDVNYLTLDSRDYTIFFDDISVRYEER